MNAAIITRVELRHEPQLVFARKRAREIAAQIGFDQQDQVRIATTVSEIARNALRYATGGVAEFRLVQAGDRPMLEVEVRDQGRGIPNLQDVLDGRYQSKTGLGMGLIGSRRLMDTFDIETSAEGTRVRFGKFIPGLFTEGLSRTAARVGLELARAIQSDPINEFAEQNRELLATLSELQRRQAELMDLNKEIDETNRGVVALYAELDDRAREVQRISDVKSRFLSNITHEFRTPLNSILSLSRLLLEGVDGQLGAEQEKQIKFIHKATRDLVDLTNDLLDLAKVESGKIEVQLAPVDVAELFATLRGMLKPTLGASAAVALVFEGAEGIPPIRTDERKLAQILRNLISNALKYTERGEVRVSTRLAAGEKIVFTVSDTGVGIDEEHHERIFEEFFQVEGTHQRRVKGTGLGLPLARKFAELLGGVLTLSSAPGSGSRFFVELPTGLGAEAGAPDAEEGKLVVFVHSQAEALAELGGLLAGSEFRPVFARSFTEGLEIVQRVRPVALVVADPANASLAAKATGKGAPVRVLLLSDSDHCPEGVHAAGPAGRLLPLLREQTAAPLDVLVIDDEEPTRYVIKKVLGTLALAPREAAGGLEGLKAAQARKPDLVILDIVMPDMNGLEVLRRLRADVATRDVPVIVYSSKTLAADDVAFVRENAQARVGKTDGDLGALAQAVRSVLPRDGRLPGKAER